MNNKKRYQKIFVNDDCVVDFTEQNIKAFNVASGNLFFDTNGKLQEGRDPSALMMSFLCDDRSNLAQTPLYRWSGTSHLNWYTINSGSIRSSAWLDGAQNEMRFAPEVQSLSMPFTLSSVSTDWNTNRVYNLTFEAGCEQALDQSQSLNYYMHDGCDGLYNSLQYAHYFESSEFDFPKYIDIPLNRGAVGCEFKTTADGKLNYVKTNNKIYLLNFNTTKLESSECYNIVLPDYIENLPVVHICDRFFSGIITNRVSQIESIKFPQFLESIGAGIVSQEGMPLQLDLPDGLKTIHIPFDIGYERIGYSEDFNVSGIVLPNSFEGFSAVAWSTTVAEYFSTNSMSDPLFDNLSYIPTKDRPHAILRQAQGETETFTVPDDCSQIYPSAINSLRTNTLILPQSMKYFTPGGYLCPWGGYDSSNSYIKTVVFNSNTSELHIAPGSFQNWENLESVNIPDCVTILPYKCFYNCPKLTTLEIPESVIYIDEAALNIGSSQNKATIVMKTTIPPALKNGAIIKNNIAKIIIPKNTLSAYKTALNWSAFGDLFEEVAN